MIFFRVCAEEEGEVPLDQTRSIWTTEIKTECEIDE